MNEYKPIILDNLFEIVTVGNEKEWDAFFRQYPHIFAPGPWRVFPTDEREDIFNHYQFLSIEYWNIYCSSKINDDSNKNRIKDLLDKYREIWEYKETKKDKQFLSPRVSKEKIRDMEDFHDIEYGASIVLEDSLSAIESHFSETIFCSILFSFFEDILTKFIFELSGNKCFENNLKYHNSIKQERYRNLYEDIMGKIKSKFKNDDHFDEAMSKFDNSIIQSIPITNTKWDQFYRKNKKIDGNEISDYKVKAMYIDHRCGSSIFKDLIDDKRFVKFSIKRNNIMHADSKPSNISTLECFDMVRDTLNYLLENKQIEKQHNVCIWQNRGTLNDKGFVFGDETY